MLYVLPTVFVKARGNAGYDGSAVEGTTTRTLFLRPLRTD